MKNSSCQRKYAYFGVFFTGSQTTLVRLAVGFDVTTAAAAVEETTRTGTLKELLLN